MANLTIGGQPYSPDDALRVCVGYAFAVRSFEWQSLPGASVDPPAADHLPRWAYRTYDCLPPEPGVELGGIDLVVADGLNAQMRSRTIAAIIAVAPEVSEAIEAIPTDATFWRLTDPSFTRPRRGTTEWYMHVAWSLLMGSPYIDIAVTHKTLHHKRPAVFPLLDNKTYAVLRPGEAWQQIHEELNADPTAWTDLEHAFAEVASREHGVPLTRLRLHDIVLWSQVTNSFDEARDAGRAWVHDT